MLGIFCISLNKCWFLRSDWFTSMSYLDGDLSGAFKTGGIELDRLNLIVGDVPFSVSCCDEELRYTSIEYFNTPSELSKEFLIGKTDAELIDIIPEAADLMLLKKKVLISGNSERKKVTVEGTSLVLICQPCYSRSTDDILGAVTIRMDETAKDAKEKEFMQIKNQLVDWKKTELELRKAIKSGEDDMDAKNTFLAVMSHEIRTPLNGVLGMAQLLTTTNLDQEQNELVSAMIFSGDVLLAIISDILDLNKVESGTMKLEERQMMPRGIVKHVVRTAICATKDREIGILTEVDEDVPSVVIGDPLRLKQVITNLVFNAVKFTKKGSVVVKLTVLKDPSDISSAVKSNKDTEIEIAPVTSAVQDEEDSVNETWDILTEGGRRNSAEHLKSQQSPEGVSDTLDCISLHENEFESDDNEEDKPVWLEFLVEDTGIGIPKDSFPSLFEKFTQVHSSTTRKYGGTGLGLAICKQLVELMGGNITVSSRVGEGSTFTFAIPCKSLNQHRRASTATTIISESDLKKNLSHTTAQIHRLHAGLSCTPYSVETTSSSSVPLLLHLELPKPANYVGEEDADADADAADADADATRSKQSKLNTLRSTSSSPALFDCSLLTGVKEFQRVNQLNIKNSDAEKRVNQLNINNSDAEKPRLLLVEDNKVNVMVALAMLKKIGYDAETAYNGLEAIRAFQMKQYDLILMDICMPVLDGFEVTKRIRSYENTGSWEANDEVANEIVPREKKGHVPIIAMTANVFLDCEAKCEDCGMDGYMTKPVTFKKLREVLDIFLCKKKKEGKVGVLPL